MADKTFGVKVSEELLDRVKEMIDASGITAKEWFEKAVSMTELHAIKQGVTDYNQDLSELEVHTTRIYELVSSMIQRSIYIKDHAIKEYADRLDQKEAIISEYQSKVTTSQEEAKVAMQMASALETEKADLLKQLEELRSVNLNNQRLIDEYNEKNDTLSGLVSKYQSFAEENEKIKGDFSKERERLQSQVKEISSQNDHQQDEIKGLTQQIETLNRNHEIEVERLTERKDYEKDKALLECERNYQERLLTANNEYSERIRDLYNEISNVRKEYEDRLESLRTETQNTKAEENSNNENN
jgi:chromosome segregation ATPase